MFNDLPYGHAVPLAALFLLFAASALVVGRREGLKCLATLLLIPLLLLAMGWVVARGWLPAGQAALLAGLVALGFQVVMLVGRRSGAAEALLGACGGYLVAVALAVLAVFSLKVTGVYSPLLRDLWYAPGTGHVSFHSLALGGIALAGAGIIADLAVAVTATVREVHLANPSLFRGRLRASGMRFGRDVICTEVNTLPLAILGASLGGVLLVLVRPDVGRWPYTWMLLANRQSTAVEVAALVAGTVGLSLTIPLTAYLVSHRLGVRPVLPAGGKPPRTSPLPAFRAALAGWGGLLVLIAILATGLCWWLGGTTYRYPPGKGNTVTRLERGKVVSVDPEVSPWAPRVDGPGAEKFQDVRVRVGGGEILAVENSLTGSPANDRVPEAGDAVIIQTQRAGKDVYARLMRISRDRGLVLLLLGTCVVVVLVARWQGWRAMAALAVCLVLIGCLLAAIVRWHVPPAATTMVYMLVVTGLVFLMICGWSRKAFCASFGAVAGIATSGAAAVAFASWLGLSGLYGSDLQTLNLYSAGRALDFQGLLVAAAMIGALGVVMDVSIGVASAVSEVRRADPSIDFHLLLAAGIAVGRKIMAAMFGAILFAYLGLNIGLFLLPWARTGSVMQALDSERVKTEVFRLLVAGLAIVWTIPATALVSAYLSSRKGRAERIAEEA